MTYAQLADAIAPHLLNLLKDTADGKYNDRAYDEDLMKEFHKRIIGAILPDIAGKWRTKLVQVGNHIPPEPREIPMRIHEYITAARFGRC
jgi:hypothetical protein